MVLRAEAFFAGLRVDVGLVIGFFAEVGFFAADFAASRDLLPCHSKLPFMYLGGAPRSTVVIECQAPIHFFLALSTTLFVQA